MKKNKEENEEENEEGDDKRRNLPQLHALKAYLHTRLKNWMQKVVSMQRSKGATRITKDTRKLSMNLWHIFAL